MVDLVRNVSFSTLVLTPFSLTQTTPNFKRLIWLPQSLETDIPHELNSKRKLLQKRSFHTFGVKILQSGNIQWDDTWVPRSSVRHLPQSSKPGKRKLFCFHILFNWSWKFGICGFRNFLQNWKSLLCCWDVMSRSWDLNAVFGVFV